MLRLSSLWAVAVLVALLNLLSEAATGLITVGTLDTSGSEQDVEVVGDVAYVVNRLGLLVIDVSDPRFPVELGRIDTPGYALAVEVVGGLAYVADGPSDSE